jgi:hypothetical protein
MIQDRTTGQWRPYPQYDDGIGNIKSPDGTAYAHDGGAQMYQQQQTQTVEVDKTGTGTVSPPGPNAPQVEDTKVGLTDPNAPDPNAPPAPPPPPTGGGGGGGGGTGLIQEYPGGPFVPPDWSAFKPAAYKAPSFEEAQNDPGYQFAQQEGQRGVERSAAARGVLNSGGTLQDIAKWNQGLATTQYQNVADRAKKTYDTNYKTQYDDPYKNAYQSAFQKYLTGYQSWLDRINTTVNLNNQ